MTLRELGAQYALAAQALRERIRQVEALHDGQEDEAEKLRLKYRLRLLRSMYRDTRTVALHLEHYYERGIRGHEDDVV